MTKTIKIETHLAPFQKTPIRLQEYGLGIFVTLSTKSALKKALKKEFILVDGKIASTATFITGGETITYNKPLENPHKKELLLDLEVVYQDEYLAIINKPAGILVSGNSFKTIDNALASNLTKSSLPDACKPRPAHRLDYPTTGLLLIGKTTASILVLNKLFETKEIEKTYFAVTIGKMPGTGILNTPIDSKKALTTFEVQQTVISERFKQLNLVKLHPKTGRRHQLRKHLAAIGNPILGDAQYGLEGKILKGKGLYLHAYSLAFTHPFTTKKILLKKELSTKYAKLFPAH